MFEALFFFISKPCLIFSVAVVGIFLLAHIMPLRLLKNLHFLWPLSWFLKGWSAAIP